MKRILLITITLFIAAASVNSASAEDKPRPLTPGGKYFKGDMDRPRPRVVTPPGFTTDATAGQAPSDAIVLFDGTSFEHWKTDKWKLEAGYMECAKGGGTMQTKEEIEGDCQWHIEWRTPHVVVGNSQGRGNSGVFIGGFPEVQVLDSFENDTYPDGQAAGLYNQYPPMVNVCRKPGEWQTYDIIIERQKKDAEGKVSAPARISVLHNGIVVHFAREINTAASKGGLSLQDHGNPIRYRNIWVRPINTVDPDSEGTPPPGK
ncbi:MAG: hypothetical protein ACI9TH_002798 [Kiritimatiellia bacterium]|jgi:hypothetical protein